MFLLSNLINFLENKFRHIVIFNKKIRINVKDGNAFFGISHFELGDLKYEIINYYLKNLNLNKSFKEHLTNFLCFDNWYIQKKACLISFLIDKNFNIDTISSPFLSKKDIIFFKKPIQIKSNYYTIIESILKQMIKIVKFFIYLMFITIKNRRGQGFSSKNQSMINQKINYYTMINSFRDRLVNIYLKKLNKSLDNSVIYIGYNLSKSKRDQEYLKGLQKNNRNYFFHFPKINNYSVLKNAIKIFVSSFPKEFKFPLLEIVIARMKIDDLVKYINMLFPDIREFYTTRLRGNTIYFTEKLKESKIKVIYCAHGLGGPPIPIVNFDVLYLFSKTQKNRYKGILKVKYYNLELPLKKREDLSNKRFAIFYIGGQLLSSKAVKSRKLKLASKEVIDYIERIAKEYNFPVYAKYHPSSKEEDKILSANITIIEKVEDLPQKYYYLAVTLTSTYAIELLKYMPFIYLNPQEKVNLKSLLPDDDLLYVKTYKELKDKIEKFKNNPNSYSKYWKSVISIIGKDFSLKYIDI